MPKPRVILLLVALTLGVQAGAQYITGEEQPLRPDPIPAGQHTVQQPAEAPVAGKKNKKTQKKGEQPAAAEQPLPKPRSPAKKRRRRANSPLPQNNRCQARITSKPILLRKSSNRPSLRQLPNKKLRKKPQNKRHKPKRPLKQQNKRCKPKQLRKTPSRTHKPSCKTATTR